MTPEDRVQELLRGAVDDVQPRWNEEMGWANVRARAVPKWPNRRRLALAAAAVLAVLSAATLLLVEEDATRVVNPPAPSTTSTAPPETTSTTEMATTTTTSVAATAPPFFVGVRKEQAQLVVADSRTGRTIRVLAEYGAGTLIRDIALTPDGTHVFFDVGPDFGPGRIHRVPVAGGRAEVVVDGGRQPAVSPDGTRLAYGMEQELVVRTLASRAERRHRLEMGVVTEAAFSADGKWIVYRASESEYNELFVIDADLRGTPRALRAESRQGGEFYRSPSARAVDGLMGFIEACCDVDATLPPSPTSFVVVELPGGRVVSRTPLTPRMERFDYDRTGRHALFVDEAGGLYAKRGDEPMQPVAEGFALADW